MKRRTTILAGLVAAALTLGVVPALAQATAENPEKRERSFPPAWIDESVDELRARIAERSAALETRITDAERLTEEQKAAALASLAETNAALDTAEENAELVGIVTSRRQLTRIEFRAERRGGTADLEGHVTRDLEGTTLRFDHMNQVVEWAQAAGEDVSEVTPLLDAADGQLDVAAGGGSIEQRHDAVHIARAWMLSAWAALMGA